jgi:hypothetical protein
LEVVLVECGTALGTGTADTNAGQKEKDDNQQQNGNQQDQAKNKLKKYFLHKDVRNCQKKC